MNGGGLVAPQLGVVAITASDMTSDTYAVDCDDMRQASSPLMVDSMCSCDNCAANQQKK